MKRSLCAVVMALVAFAPHAFGDSIPTFNITQVAVSVSINDGSGDNVFFSLIGPGTNISGFGGISCYFSYCSSNDSFAPGTSLIPSIGQIFISDFASAMVGGKTYDPYTEIGFTSLFSANVLGSFTFPDNFYSSTFCVPASMSSPLGGIAGSGETFTMFNLNMPAGGNFCTSWNFSGQYQFTHGSFVATTTTVPEPGTLGLIVTGLTAMVGLIRQGRLLAR
jgi:hypothetical protein